MGRSGISTSILMNIEGSRVPIATEHTHTHTHQGPPSFYFDDV